LAIAVQTIPFGLKIRLFAPAPTATIAVSLRFAVWFKREETIVGWLGAKGGVQLFATAVKISDINPRVKTGSQWKPSVE
jgi:hypothetical protein